MSIAWIRVALSAAVVASALNFSATAFAFNPTDPVNLNIMTSEYNRGNFDEAEQIGLKILRSEPTNLAVHYLLGNIYAKGGSLERALRQYTYCSNAGRGSQIGAYATEALSQIRNAQATARAQSGNFSAAAPKTAFAAPAVAAPAAADVSTAKVDLQTLEYQERLLEAGADLVAANRVKLQKQIETLQSQSSKDPSLPNPANKIRDLENNNAAEELKITAFYKQQVDAIGKQKVELSSQAHVGQGGDVRLIEDKSSLFVRNYINFHGEVPLPPPPPELRATALKLGQWPGGKKTGSDSKSVRP